MTKTIYDLAGNAVKQTHAKNKSTLTSFDSRYRRECITDGISTASTYTFLAKDQPASFTDAESQSTSYTYDARVSKLTEEYPDHASGSTVGQPCYGIVTFVYDKASRDSRKQVQVGDTCTNNYELASRMTSRNYRRAANSPASTIAAMESFTRDPIGYEGGAFGIYEYCHSKPHIYMDPFGKQIRPPLTGSGYPFYMPSPYTPPPPPPRSSTDPWNLQFGTGYGNWCGFMRAGQNGPPIDFLDHACREHDRCIPNLRINICWEIPYCNAKLCQDAASARDYGCALSYPGGGTDRENCRDAAQLVAALFCGMSLQWELGL